MRAIVGGILVLLAGAAGFCLGRQRNPPAPAGTASTHTGPTVEQVQQLAALITTRVEIADVQVTSASGYVGAMKVAILVKGDLLLSVDLSGARFEKVDGPAKTAVLVLPQPQVTSPRLDHDRTRLFEITTSGLWQLVPGDSAKAVLIGRAYTEAQDVVAHAADDPALLRRSRQQAEQVLGTFFTAQGWSLTIRWAD